jgi:toluene methyl-monooxygenase
MDYLRYYLVPLTTFCGALGFILGGGWVWLGAATFPVLLVLDILLPRDFAPRKISNRALADVPLYLHVGLMVTMYVAFVLSIAIGTNPIAGPDAVSQIAGSMLSLIWLSAVPTVPVSHELLHRRHWFPRRAAQLLNSFFGDPNRDIGHIRTHHIHLDTHGDSDTPVRGETMYAFALRATIGSYRDAFRSECDRLHRTRRSSWHWSNRTYQQIGLLAVQPALAYVFAGVGAALVYAAVLVCTKFLLEGFNYFQHYGLVRVEGGPVNKHHAWNHMGVISRALGLEITNHINHHMDSYTRYYDLQPEPDAPQMPSLFLCFALSLVPPLWFRMIIMPLLRDWDERYASPQERELARAENAHAGWPQWLDEPPKAVPANAG